MNVKKIYQQLLRQYGPQGWWPLTLPENVCGNSKYYRVESPSASDFGKSKFEASKARGKPVRFEYGLCYGIPYKDLKNCQTKFRDPYFEIAVGAILTQNTTWKNVATAIINLYNAKALTPKRILKMNTLRLQKLIRPAGYFRQKAKKIKLFSQWLIKNYNGDIKKLSSYKLSRKRDPVFAAGQVTRSKLLEQWGIGPETADSIILYGLNKPIFVVDEYTRRLCKKFGIVYNTYDKYRLFFEKELPRNAKIYQEYHALMVAWGKNNKGY